MKEKIKELIFSDRLIISLLVGLLFSFTAFCLNGNYIGAFLVGWLFTYFIVGSNLSEFIKSIRRNNLWVYLILKKTSTKSKKLEDK